MEKYEKPVMELEELADEVTTIACFGSSDDCSSGNTGMSFGGSSGGCGTLQEGGA